LALPALPILSSSSSQPVSSSSFSISRRHRLVFFSFLFLAVRRCIPFPPNSPTSHASDNTLIEISLPTSGVFFFFLFFFFLSLFLSYFLLLLLLLSV
jgi:hypothetical protein